MRLITVDFETKDTFIKHKLGGGWPYAMFADTADFTVLGCGLGADDLEYQYLTDPEEYGKQPTEEDCDAAWAILKLIRQLFEDASNEHAAILFTADRS